MDKDRGQVLPLGRLQLTVVLRRLVDFDPALASLTRHLWHRLVDFMDHIEVLVWLKLGLPPLYVVKELLLHLGILEVGVGVLGAHDILVEESLAVFYLTKLEI